jgi:hypothetical protein
MKLDVLIVGAGGNGQTYFMEFLQKNGFNINKLDDSDKFKHMCSPSKIHNLNFINRIIFIYNKPYEAIQSHYRRKWSFIQMQKLGNPYCFNEDQIDTLQKYNELVIKNKLDLFGIEYQFYNWYKSRDLLPILFMDFNEVLDQKHILNAFLKKELDYSIFNYAHRNCVDSENPVIKQLYQKLYYDIKENAENHNEKIKKLILK